MKSLAKAKTPCVPNACLATPYCWKSEKAWWYNVYLKSLYIRFLTKATGAGPQSPAITVQYCCITGLSPGKTQSHPSSLFAVRVHVLPKGNSWLVALFIHRWIWLKIYRFGFWYCPNQMAWVKNAELRSWAKRWCQLTVAGANWNSVCVMHICIRVKELLSKRWSPVAKIRIIIIKEKNVIKCCLAMKNSQEWGASCQVARLHNLMPAQIAHKLS